MTQRNSIKKVCHDLKTRRQDIEAMEETVERKTLVLRQQKG